MSLRQLLVLATGPSLVLSGVVGVFRHSGWAVPGRHEIPGLLWRG